MYGASVGGGPVGGGGGRIGAGYPCPSVLAAPAGLSTVLGRTYNSAGSAGALVGDGLRSSPSCAKRLALCSAVFSHSNIGRAISTRSLLYGNTVCIGNSSSGIVLASHRSLFPSKYSFLVLHRKSWRSNSITLNKYLSLSTGEVLKTCSRTSTRSAAVSILQSSRAS